jgi:sortase A
VNLYIITLPFVPGVFFHIQQHRGIQHQLQQAIVTPGASSPSVSGNRLIVPAMLLNAPINDGAQYASLAKGLWRVSSSSTPAQGSNTVIIGHRFTYTNPEGVFYNLDKIHVGDEIGVFWQGKRYLYTVAKTLVVPPNDIAVQAPTSQRELTLYTCTPLWLPKNRLVVVATEVAT